MIDSPSPLEKNAAAAAAAPPEMATTPVGGSSATADPGLFISYQPEGPTPVAVKREDSLKWLEPNVSTPSAASSHTPAATPSPVKQPQQKKPAGVSHLFQYTSGIPFAPRPSSSGGGGEAAAAGAVRPKEEAKPKPLWEVPETPHRA